MKLCNICKNTKLFSEFSKSNAPRGDGYQYTCRSCNTVQKQKWYKENKNKNRDTKYKKKFGISLDEAINILALQGGKCAICETPMEMGPKTHLDHNHETNKVRGFLCQKCNHGLGLFQDSEKFLKSAQDYLQKYNSELQEK
jgi:uncharacterized protein YlaI